ncbi:MAG: Phosphoenolpyruvate carboxykinase (ATP) [Syntrophomonadaceae bacterium]|nr:Phosphoenolpyruvate carboxykinase (ATP) [Bacillota bacterium]
MTQFGVKSAHAGLNLCGLNECKTTFWNLSPAELTQHALNLGEGQLTSTGAFMADTGTFTGRAPEDKFFVKDALTSATVWWGKVNQGVDAEVFDKLLGKMLAYLSDKEIFVRDCFACADPDYRTNIRVINTKAYHNIFVYNMFIRPTQAELESFIPEYTIICVPEFEAEPEVDGVPRKNFAIIDMTRKMVIIGGTGYTGEIKKGVFTILNFVLPELKGVMSMHCSANIGQEGDVAVFFGLSGTGKTTLSADPNRNLIGDDEHGWTDKGVFNFEGGCYAKVINITKESEPEIFDAIKTGAVLENTRFFEGTNEVDYSNVSVTQNTRVSYPLYHIANAVEPSIGGHPKNIFFLAADAFGVMPPISKLNTGQAMFHFISGYTAKVAGTEVGVTEPKTTFSACFGAPFMPLHPTRYAELLGKKMQEHQVNVWLINTGWTGGSYGTGSRMKLSYTRAMITAALKGELNDVEYLQHPVFGFMVPQTCPNVPDNILNPKDTWFDKEAYDNTASKLAKAFLQNFEAYESFANEEIMAGAPKAIENTIA